MKSLVPRIQLFSLAVIHLFDSLPRRRVAYVLGDQFLRAGLSPGGHFREALRARSKAEYVAKLNGGLMELEETLHWLELLVEATIVTPDAAKPILSEIDQLIAIFTSLINKWRPGGKAEGLMEKAEGLKAEGLKAEGLKAEGRRMKAEGKEQTSNC